MVGTPAAKLPHYASPAPAVESLGIKLLGDLAIGDDASGGETALDQARREAVAEAEAAAFQQRQAEERADFELRLAEAEQSHNENTAKVLAEGVSAAFAAIEASIAAEVARVLARFLSEAVRERALADLVQSVSSLLASGGAGSLRIVGPPTLVEALRGRLGQNPAGTAFVTEEGAPEVTVTINDTAIRTCIGDWLDRLAAAGGEVEHG
jgi:hypothetical protein